MHPRPTVAPQTSSACQQALKTFKNQDAPTAQPTIAKIPRRGDPTAAQIRPAIQQPCSNSSRQLSRPQTQSQQVLSLSKPRPNTPIVSQTSTVQSVASMPGSASQQKVSIVIQPATMQASAQPMAVAKGHYTNPLVARNSAPGGNRVPEIAIVNLTKLFQQCCRIQPRQSWRTGEHQMLLFICWSSITHEDIKSNEFRSLLLPGFNALHFLMFCIILLILSWTFWLKKYFKMYWKRSIKFKYIHYNLKLLRSLCPMLSSRLALLSCIKLLKS